MASAAPNGTPSPATCQSNFEQGVACAMHLWPRLEDAVEDQLGGPDSADKRDWFVGSVVELFPDFSKSRAQQQRDGEVTEDPEQYDVEYRLLQVMDDEFELKIDDDDDSAYTLAEQIMRLRAACVRGDFAEVEQLQQRFGEKEAQKANKKKRKVIIKEEDQDTDGDSEDDDEEEDDQDVEMDGVSAPATNEPRKQKEEPEVDEEGFTKVTRKKR